MSAKLQENANAAYAALYEEQASVSTQLRTALKKVEELARIDGSLERVVETLKSAAIGVDDASDAIRDYLDKLEADPKRLDEIESRLALIERLKRKYGGTVSAALDDVLAFLEDVRAKMEAIETAGERRAKLEQDLAQASAAYRERAAALTECAEGRGGEAGEEGGDRARFAGARERRISHRNAGGELVREWRGSRGVPDLGERGRRAESAG